MTNMREQAKADPKAVAKACMRVLVEFGYTSLTAEFCEQIIRHNLEGHPDTGIIAMFINKWLEEGL